MLDLQFGAVTSDQLYSDQQSAQQAIMAERGSLMPFSSSTRRQGSHQYGPDSAKRLSPMEEMLAALGDQHESSSRPPRYASVRDNRSCMLYVGLAHNRESFEDWYTTKFVPMVWTPKETAGKEAREKKFRALRLQFLMQRHRSATTSTIGRASPPPTAVPPRSQQVTPAQQQAAAKGKGKSKASSSALEAPLPTHHEEDDQFLQDAAATAAAENELPVDQSADSHGQGLGFRDNSNGQKLNKKQRNANKFKKGGNVGQSNNNGNGQGKKLADNKPKEYRQYAAAKANLTPEIFQELYNAKACIN